MIICRHHFDLWYHCPWCSYFFLYFSKIWLYSKIFWRLFCLSPIGCVVFVRSAREWTWVWLTFYSYCVCECPFCAWDAAIHQLGCSCYVRIGFRVQGGNLKDLLSWPWEGSNPVQALWSELWSPTISFLNLLSSGVVRVVHMVGGASWAFDIKLAFWTVILLFSMTWSQLFNLSNTQFIYLWNT